MQCEPEEDLLIPEVVEPPQRTAGVVASGVVLRCAHVPLSVHSVVQLPPDYVHMYTVRVHCTIEYGPQQSALDQLIRSNKSFKFARKLGSSVYAGNSSTFCENQEIIASIIVIIIMTSCNNLMILANIAFILIITNSGHGHDKVYNTYTVMASPIGLTTIDPIE